MSAATTAAAVVRRYVDELYHRRNTAVIHEVVADPTIRHEPDGHRHELTLADSLARAAKLQQDFTAMRFDEVVLVADDRDVCWVFDAVLTRADGREVKMSGAEIFRVVDGRITEVWNPAPTIGGRWG